MLDGPFESLKGQIRYPVFAMQQLLSLHMYVCNITRRNIGPNQVKNMKSKGLLTRRGDTMGFFNVASRLALALLSFLDSETLSASIKGTSVISSCCTDST